MTAAAIQLDLDLLNELFDNQKKLDAVLDDDFFIGSPMSFGEDEASAEKSSQDSGGFHSYDDLPFNFDDDLFEQKSRSMVSIVIPVVLEVAAIAYGLMYLIGN